MCLACEMDALWFAEMQEAVVRAKAEADGKASDGEAPAGKPEAAPAAPPAAAGAFVCEETPPE
jgi:hypothetical protein